MATASSVLVMGADRRFLPTEPSEPEGIALGDHEQLSEGLSRVTHDQFRTAIRSLLSGRNPDDAVHGTRKTIKRLRAVLRLVRDEIGERAFKAEDAVLREAANLLAPVRDGKVAVDTVASLRSRHAELLQPTAFASLQEILNDRYRVRRADALSHPEGIERAVYLLRRAQARFAAWPVSDEELVVSGGRAPIRHAFGSIEPGLARTYRKGRVGWQRSAQTRQVEDFHEWRKEVKYLRHQLELLQPLWPDVVGGIAASLSRLGDVLGEEHDLAELLILVGREPRLCPNGAERSLLYAIAQQRRAELHEQSLNAGARLFGEPPKRFCARMGLYWEAWSLPGPALPVIDLR